MPGRGVISVLPAASFASGVKWAGIRIIRRDPPPYDALLYRLPSAAARERLVDCGDPVLGERLAKITRAFVLASHEGLAAGRLPTGRLARLRPNAKREPTHVRSARGRRGPSNRRIGRVRGATSLTGAGPAAGTCELQTMSSGWWDSQRGWHDAPPARTWGLSPYPRRPRCPRKTRLRHTD